MLSLSSALLIEWSQVLINLTNCGIIDDICLHNDAFVRMHNDAFGCVNMEQIEGRQTMSTLFCILYWCLSTDSSKFPRSPISCRYM